MRDVSDAFLSAVQGSNTPVVVCDVWHGGEVVRHNIRIAGGQIEYDTTNANIEGSLSITLVDEQEGGSRLADVIHAIGMRVNVRAGFDMAGTVETVSMGWFDIFETESVDAWEWFDWREGAVKTSSVVHVQAHDLLSIVAASPFLTPTQPTAGADAWATIADLCLGIVQVNDPEFEPKTIPACP